MNYVFYLINNSCIHDNQLCLLVMNEITFVINMNLPGMLLRIIMLSMITAIASSYP